MAELNYKQIFEDYIRAGSDSHKKTQAVKNIFELAKHKILSSNEMNKFYPGFKGKIEFNLTNSASQKPEDKQNKTGSEYITGYDQAAQYLDETGTLQVPVNIDFDAIKNEPPDVVYAGFYASMYQALFSKAIEMENGKTGSLVKKDAPQQSQDISAEVEKSDLELVVDYIKEKILKLFGIKDSSSAINSFTSDFQNENGGVGLEQEWYDFTFTRNAGLAQAGRMATKAQEALRAGDPELANALRSQGRILAASMSDRDFNVLVDGNDKQALAEFAQKYAITYLTANGVDPRNIDLTMENKGALGTFYPAQVPGGRCKVNINTVEIKKMNNPTEVALTLSHELRHAIDATQASILNGDAQARLQFNITESVGLGNPRIDGNRQTYTNEYDYNRDVKAYDLLLDLKNACYYANPNERMARIAELSALEFMKLKSKGDPETREYIKRATYGFIEYQGDTVEKIKEVAKEGYVDGKRAEYKKIGLDENDELHNMFNMRFDYLDNLKKGGFLNTKAEENAIAQARQLLAELEGKQVQQENQRTTTQEYGE